MPGSIKSFEADYPGISERTRIARIPTISGEDPVIVASLPQGLGINAELEGDKLEAAIEYVKYIAGESYSKHMAEIGEMGPVIVDIDTSNLLPMQQDMFSIMNAYQNVNQLNALIPAAVASEQQASISSFLSGAMSAEEVAASVQAIYEQ